MTRGKGIPTVAGGRKAGTGVGGEMPTSSLGPKGQAPTPNASDSPSRKMVAVAVEALGQGASVRRLTYRLSSRAADPVGGWVATALGGHRAVYGLTSNDLVHRLKAVVADNVRRLTETEATNPFTVGVRRSQQAYH